MTNRYADFLQNSGLYDSIPVDKESISELITLIHGSCRIDVYCPSCRTQRVFRMNPIISFSDSNSHGIKKELLSTLLLNEQNRQMGEKIPAPGQVYVRDEPWNWDKKYSSDTHVMVFQFRCTMCEGHTLDYAVLNMHDHLIKIGQYPSIADLSSDELQEYRKDIDEQSFKELRRAIGLHAQGIGVGSYVYLRKVFERILNKAGDEAISDGAIDEEILRKSKVDEKIRLLKDYLPKALSGNAVFYGIVSKGIHELSEEECIQYFPVLKSCIVLILRQWKKQREDKENEKEISRSISRIAGQINSK